MPFRFGLGGHEARVADGLLDFGSFPFPVDGDGLFDLPVGTTFTDGLYDLDFFWEVPPWVPPKPWTVQLCNNGAPIGTCTAFEFSAVQNRNLPGNWELVTSDAGVPSSASTPDGVGGFGEFDPRDVTEVRLIAEGRIVYAGAVQGEDAGFYVISDDRGERWRLTGIDLGWHRLASRFTYPDPAVASGWSVSHDVRTAVASTALAEYINANAGVSALADRVIAGLDVADEAVGVSTSFSTRLESLAALATRIGNDGGFEVLCEYDFAGAVTYRLSAARDLSGVVVFSDQGDLLNSTARFQRRGATYVLTGGTGEGAARTFRSASAGITGADRIEFFSDQRAMSSSGEVQADADAKLVAAASQFQMTTTLTDAVATQAINSGLRVGDKVGVVVRGRRYVAPIEAVQFHVTPTRQVMRPRFGSAQPDSLRNLLGKVRSTALQLTSNIV